MSVETVPDEDWKFAYRRHFKTELVSPRILVQPEWEEIAVIKFDPGMAFGTGKHETTKACLQYIDECAKDGGTFLDMGCGSGILSIAAAMLGYKDVSAFDVDQEAVDATIENSEKNNVEVTCFKYALGSKVKRALPMADLVAANILGPLLIRFADEICAAVSKRIIISGILTELYPEVLAAFNDRGLKEVSRKTIGEWTTGLLER
jgi:ribosomal protein L11 methyltransferase